MLQNSLLSDALQILDLRHFCIQERKGLEADCKNGVTPCSEFYCNSYIWCFQAEDGWFSRKCRKINLSTSKLSYIFPSSFNAYFADDGECLGVVFFTQTNIISS